MLERVLLDMKIGTIVEVWDDEVDHISWFEAVDDSGVMLILMLHERLFLCSSYNDVNF